MNDLAGHWVLDPDVVYLNHGSFGAAPRVVLEEQQRWRSRMEANPTAFLGRQVHQKGLLDTARSALAAFVGADLEGLAFVRNATSGVNAVLRSLDLSPGDEIVVTDHEYNACRNAAEFAAGRAGATVVVASIPFPIDGPETVKQIVLGAVTERTRLVMIDHVTSPTGLVFPIEDIVATLEPEVPVLVDGAHAPGMVPLRMDDLGAAFYAGNCHKWLCAPKGVGFLAVREDHRDRIVPSVVSHGLNDPRPGRSRFRKLFDWTGTDDPTPALSVPAAIEFVETVVGGWKHSMAVNHDLAIEGRRVVCEAVGREPPAPEGMVGSMASIEIPPGPRADVGSLVDPLTELLFERWRIEVPVFSWPDPARRVLRISAQVYNTIDDCEMLAEAVAEVLSEGR